MILTYRPIAEPWGTQPSKNRRPRSTFKASWADTMCLLDRELSHLKATAAVLQLDVAESAIRLDGLLRANTEPATPGVRLVADTRFGTLSWQTDSCAWWRHNVRSIALGLEALRAVDRYGVTSRGEQYTGWLQLEAGPSFESPREVLWRIGQAPTSATEDHAWRLARAAAHPDRNAGRRDAWDEVEAAAKELGLL